MAATDPVHETVNAVYHLRVAARAGDADPAARRLRRRRGSAARRVQGGARAVAARRRAGESARMARLGRPLQGDRQPAPPARFDALDDVGDKADVAVHDAAAWADAESVEDDRLRLIFTCCHPALRPTRRWR